MYAPSCGTEGSWVLYANQEKRVAEGVAKLLPWFMDKSYPVFGNGFETQEL